MTKRRLPLRHVKGASHGRQAKHGYERIQRGRRVLAHLPFVRFSFRFIAVVCLFTLAILTIRLISQSDWNGRDRITFTLQDFSESQVGGEVFLVSYLPPEGLSVVVLPATLQIETIGGFGLWKAGSVYQLGELEGRGGALLSGTLAEFFGVNVDGWVVSPEKVQLSSDTLKTSLKTSLMRTLFGRGRSNLGVWDLFRLWFSLGKVRLSQATLVDLSTASVLREETLPDGSTTYRTDPEWLDQLARRLFALPEITREGLSVSVLNATGHPRLGNRAARAIENAGGDVVSIADFKTSEEQTTIVGSSDSLRSSVTVGVLQKFFTSEKVSVGETASARADILLVVGEDYFRKLSEF